MINNYCDAAVPAPGEFSDEDRALLEQAHGALETARAHFEVQAFHEALEVIWKIVRAANAYVDHQAPWELRKTDPERTATVLYVLAEAIRHLGILCQPYMPDSSARLLDQLEIAADKRDFAALGPDDALTAGTALPKPSGIFPRYVEEAAKAG